MCTTCMCMGQGQKLQQKNLFKYVDGTQADHKWNMGGPQVEFTYMCGPYLEHG